MKRSEFLKLERGDIIVHKSDPSTSYMIDANYGSRITAVTTVDVTNPKEWAIRRKI